MNAKTKTETETLPVPDRRVTDLRQLAPAVRVLVERAKAELGSDLAGFSAVDLVLDNSDKLGAPHLDVDHARVLLDLAGYPAEAKLERVGQAVRDLVAVVAAGRRSSDEAAPGILPRHSLELEVIGALEAAHDALPLVAHGIRAALRLTLSRAERAWTRPRTGWRAEVAERVLERRRRRETMCAPCWWNHGQVGVPCDVSCGCHQEPSS